MPETSSLIERKEFGSSLTTSEKRAFANALLRNQDCSEAFFFHFVNSQSHIADLDDFFERAKAIKVRVRNPRPRKKMNGHLPSRPSHREHQDVRYVAIVSTHDSVEHISTGTDAVQAIHFGLKASCVDQLGFLDDIYDSFLTYTVYPCDIKTPLTNTDLERRLLAQLTFSDYWATIRIGDFALDNGIRNRVPIDDIKTVLSHWLTDYPDVVTGIATSERFIAGGFTTAYRREVLKGFIATPGSPYVSHLRIHQGITAKTDFDKELK